jgi:GntR family transcriptional regulator
VATRPTSTNRSPASSDARSRTATRPGELLPPAKDLAAVLGVNTNTVPRALRVLRDEGLLEFRRGRGISVSGTPERGAVLARAKELVDFARLQGYRRDELAKIIEELG